MRELLQEGIAGSGISTPETTTITTFNPDSTFVVNKQAFANVNANRGSVKEITFKITDLEGDNLQVNLQFCYGKNLQPNLESNVAGNKTYALKLDSNLMSITHNPFVVPDWGVLRFDDINQLLNLPTARLIVDPDPSSIFQKLEPGSLINTSVRQSQIPNEGIMNSEDGLRVNSSPQASTNQNSFFQIGVEQVGIPQSSFGQISSEQVGFTQVNITPISSTQNSISQIGFAQINFNQVTPNHTGSEQVGFAQVTSFNTSAAQVSTSEINPSQINIFHDPGRTQFDSSEVTLTSSITLEQFLSIHNFLSASNTPTSPSDAFEVALFNANTKQSLINTVTGLTQTDSLLNIQNDGTAYSSNKVTLVNTTPDSKLTLNQPLSFKVDLTGIQALTAATLYFDLLGFGARDAKVVLDNVMLLNNDRYAPVANNDAATTNQTKPVTGQNVTHIFSESGEYI